MEEFLFWKREKDYERLKLIHDLEKNESNISSSPIHSPSNPSP
jgi:hypothetical protein